MTQTLANDATLKNDGATPEPFKPSETCPMHPAGGKHYWQWKELLELRVCGTWGEERKWTKRFEGQ